MKICLISHSASLGGAERSLLELIDALQELYHKVLIILPRKGPLVEEIVRRKINYKIIPYNYWVDKVDIKVLLRIPLIIWNLIISIPIALRLKKWQCDVVITQTITVCSGAIAAKLIRIPHIWNIRECGYDGHGYKFHLGNKLSYWLMNRLSTLFIANSFAVAKHYSHHIPFEKLLVLYNPIYIDSNYSKISIENRNQFDIICTIVGIVKETKGQEEAIRAVGDLVKQGIKAQLWIIGKGYPKYINKLKKLINDNQLEKNVIFIGQVDNVLPYIKESDVILSCSRYEAFSRAVMEGIRAGKPVIGTNSGGTVEQIRHGFNGFLYKPKDYKELSNYIKYLYENPEMAKKMGLIGQKWANEKFTREGYKNAICTILNKIWSKGVAI